jgi:hypothetical protein
MTTLAEHQGNSYRMFCQNYIYLIVGEHRHDCLLPSLFLLLNETT